jgi:hypothetical protein
MALKIPMVLSFRRGGSELLQQLTDLGSAHRMRAGEANVKRFDLPGAKRFAVAFCPECGTRVPHKVATTANVLIPAGVLDADPGVRPDMSIYWKSRSAWYVPVAQMQTFDEHG